MSLWLPSLLVKDPFGFTKKARLAEQGREPTGLKAGVAQGEWPITNILSI